MHKHQGPTIYKISHVNQQSTRLGGARFLGSSGSQVARVVQKTCTQQQQQHENNNDTRSVAVEALGGGGMARQNANDEQLLNHGPKRLAEASTLSVSRQSSRSRLGSTANVQLRRGAGACTAVAPARREEAV